MFLRLCAGNLPPHKAPVLEDMRGRFQRHNNASASGDRLVGHCETAEESHTQANRFGRLAVDDGSDNPAHRIEFVRNGSNVWFNFTSALYRGEHAFYQKDFP